MIYAAIWLAGISVGAMAIPAGANLTCADMVAIMEADTDTAFAEHRFGLAIGNGAITRKADWSYSCEAEAPAIGDTRQAE
jgi:hypothetical protein